MNWYEWLTYHYLDNSVDTYTKGILKRAYIAGLQTAYDQLYMNEDGDYDFVMARIKQLIEESNTSSIPTIPEVVNPYNIKTSCSICGLNMLGVMGYVCSNNSCPMFTRVTC